MNCGVRKQTKKVKQKREMDANSSPSQNNFQRILTSVQAMKHKRPKGYYGDQTPRKKKKGKR